MSRSRPTQGHSLSNIGNTKVPNATYQVSRPSVSWSQRRRFLLYMGMAAMFVMLPGPFHKFLFLSPLWLCMIFVTIDPVAFWRCFFKILYSSVKE